ncbi:polysaccharide deacetylase family protein [Conexibacter sp. JD483]|uniref:polysaccharide deacetylase family protein n=1 Tax=unclassified Conexibacter TaxID=2627773 RepID=UPI0027272DDB|nr:MULTISPECIES: polysaccharide deacetylase family protein [unclassified Conexibacter]MDO8184238.1 polysaccharide deacetylase family protein [Conexibacter sp. CPCC 205706]MDO8197230.1 polysaccharide deacetylase family protein [Conexibacter sp. CPCC 205762]MDR9367455.1 polysaccharide deacetylase family protein [Conexibacter sp. JD483]
MRPHATRNSPSRIATLLVALIATLLACASAAQAARTVVTLGFDGGLASQYAQRSVVSDHRVHATYFVNTNKLGTSGRMTWTQLRALVDAGNEAGGHTLDYRSLPPLSRSDQIRQVCDDRTALTTAGYTAISFAYPGGSTNSAVQRVVSDCGYETARTYGGLDFPPDCCEYSESLPPRNAFAVRAIQPRLDTDLSDITDVIDRAQDGSGGWIDIVLHDICTNDCSSYDDDAISAATLDGLLDWIETQPDVSVKSTAEALGRGPPPDTTAPTVSLTAPADRATVSGTVSLTASASDDTGVTRVDFLVGGNVVGSDTSSPYELSWDSTRAGSSATITAKAYDGAGNNATATAHTVTVTHSVPVTTYVTFGFDDGLASQYAQRSVLSDHGVHATYFLNSNRIGTSGYMSWSDVRALSDAGHEIGGHTLDHRALTSLSEPDMRTQVCDDRTAINGHGYSITAFAYPNGLTNATAKGVVRGCGYTTARTTGGLDYGDPCCVFAETMGPRDPFGLRALEPRASTTAATFEDAIDRARTTRGGWVNFVMHDLCTGSCTGFDSYAVNVTTLDAVLDWIDTQPDIAVKNTAEVLALGDRTLPYLELTAPADRATVSPGPVTISADAIDNVSVAYVEFLVNDVVVGRDSSDPYSVTWDASTSTSPATIVARAYDRAGNVARSVSRTVTIR